MSRSYKSKTWWSIPKATYAAKYRASERNRVRQELRKLEVGNNSDARRYVDCERYFDHWAYD